MHRCASLVLIASVSPHGARQVESILKETGLSTTRVGDAEEAAKELAATDTAGVLVIDSGLLEARHDAQWREFRMRHPDVRTARPDSGSPSTGVQRCDRSTLLVHPGDPDGLREAVAILTATPPRRSPAPSSRTRPRRRRHG